MGIFPIYKTISRRREMLYARWDSAYNNYKFHSLVATEKWDYISNDTKITPKISPPNVYF